MLNQEKIVTIKVLHQQGKAIKAIARDLSLARNTVRKYLQTENATPTYHRTAPAKPSKLEPFKEYLQQRIKQAHPEWIPASVLYQEILALGYQGKDRILRHYLARLRPHKATESVIRFETEPGHQMQVDFTTISKGVKAFVATLGYSRASFVYFYDNERSEAWIDGLKRSFEFFGGVPQEVLFDNAKCVVIMRDAYAQGEHRWNTQLINLVKDYRFRPRACRPYRAQTKGKVERFNRYLKQSFIVPLKATLNAAQQILTADIANQYIGTWLHDTANCRTHATTKQRPVDLWQQEKQALLPLPTDIGNGNLTPLAPTRGMPLPVESIQHPLSIYDQLLEVRHGFNC